MPVGRIEICDKQRNSMNIHHLITEITEKLLPEYGSKHMATQSAWWLLQKITSKNESHLIAQHEIYLSQREAEQLDEWIADIVLLHKPLAYILGSVPFLNLTLDVKPPILIPRPETEEWCNDLIQELKTSKQHSYTILDLCAGSGCIALALAKAFPASTVIATDINSESIELVVHNAQKNGITNVITILSDLYKNIPEDRLFDVIVSNPPYISEEEFVELDPSVTEWEDKRALVAQEHGLALLKEIIFGAPQRLAYNGVLWVEIGYKQGAAVAQIFRAVGFKDVQIIKDLAGNDRVVKGIWNEAPMPIANKSI